MHEKLASILQWYNERALIKTMGRHSHCILQWISQTKNLNIYDDTIRKPFTCSISGQQCPVKIAFLGSLMWHVSLTGHLNYSHENEACYLCFTGIFTPDQKIFIPKMYAKHGVNHLRHLCKEDTFIPWVDLPKSFWILGMPFIRNTGTQVWPCHLVLDTILTKPSLISVGLGLLQSCLYF